MRFDNQLHRSYCGIDLHARSMFIHDRTSNHPMQASSAKFIAFAGNALNEIKKTFPRKERQSTFRGHKTVRWPSLPSNLLAFTLKQDHACYIKNKPGNDEHGS